MEASAIEQAPGFYKWLNSILLGVVGFFLIMTYNKLDSVDTNLRYLVTNDAVQNATITGNTTEISNLKSELKEVKNDLKSLQLQYNEKK